MAGARTRRVRVRVRVRVILTLTLTLALTRCPYSERVWLALEHKGIAYETVLIDNTG